MRITCMSISFTRVRSTIKDGTTYQTTLLRDIGYVIIWRFRRCILMERTPYSIEMHRSSIAEYEWPNGSYWAKSKATAA